MIAISCKSTVVENERSSGAVHGLRYTCTRPLRRTVTPNLQNRGAYLRRLEAGDPGRKRLLAARRSPTVVPNCQSESRGPRIPGWALAWSPGLMTKGTCVVCGSWSGMAGEGAAVALPGGDGNVNLLPSPRAFVCVARLPAFSNAALW
jgi:hypothetical protein